METGFSGERCLNLADLDHSFGCTAKEFCGLRQVSAGLGLWGCHSQKEGSQGEEWGSDGCVDFGGGTQRCLGCSYKCDRLSRECK